ncbi:hypothetical protein C8J55DRAFT_60288 [Lentinula edodes]|uniref:Uncharacterized protein n=1 Tax=Lentinula lateritia TaxID=40482 RepID=A0A9W9AFR9_9AGAR|nr:hypothetical protein C8J55DRAFT_60288 [Lentinula edodes]
MDFNASKSGSAFHRCITQFHLCVTMRSVFLTLAAVGVGLVSAVPITPTSDSLLPCAVCPAIVESDDLLPFVLTQSTEGLLSIVLQCDYTNLLGSASCSYFVSTTSIIITVDV